MITQLTMINTHLGMKKKTSSCEGLGCIVGLNFEIFKFFFFFDPKSSPIVAHNFSGHQKVCLPLSVFYYVAANPPILNSNLANFGLHNFFKNLFILYIAVSFYKDSNLFHLFTTRATSQGCFPKLLILI